MDADGYHFGAYGGNPDLNPESADALTAGLVLRSRSDRPLLSSMQLFSRDPAGGGIVGVMGIYKNMVGYEVSGVDVQFDWSFGAGPGTVGVKLVASGMDYFEATDVEGLPAVDDVGNIGGHFDSPATSSGTA